MVPLAALGGWCLFSSEMEVRFFTEALLRHNMDVRALGKFKIAALGRDIEDALLQTNIRTDRSLKSKRRGLNACSRARAGNLVLFSEEMPAEGEKWSTVLRLKLFRAEPVSWEPHWIREIRDRPPDFILCRNAAEVDGLVRVLGRETTRDLSEKCGIIAAGRAAAAEARRHSLKFSTVCPDFTDLPKQIGLKPGRPSRSSLISMR